MRHDSIPYETWLIHVRHDSFGYATRLIYRSVEYWWFRLWVMSHICNISDSCHEYKWVTSHIWMSHVTDKWVSNIDASDCESYHTYEWVMSHIRWPSIQWVMSHIWMSHEWRSIHGDACMLMPQHACWYMLMLKHTCWRRVTWRCSYVWHDLFVPTTWLIHMCDICVKSWCFRLAEHVNESCHTCERVMSHMQTRHATSMWMSHVTHMNESRHTYEWVKSHIWTIHVARINMTRHTYK